MGVATETRVVWVAGWEQAEWAEAKAEATAAEAATVVGWEVAAARNHFCVPRSKLSLPGRCWPPTRCSRCARSSCTLRGSGRQ